MLPIQTLLRNALCQLLAYGVIASGRVRHAKKKALSENVITSIYFHKPNKRLFARCIRWLTDNGYTFISANDLVDILYRGKAIPTGAVWLSFDDGYKEWLQDVMPIVLQRHVPVTLFIPSGIVENGGWFPWLHQTSANGPGVRDALTVTELKQIAAAPEVTIGGHTVNHSITVSLTEEQTRFELGESKCRLEAWTGAPVNCFSYPVGLFDGRERPVLTEFGYRVGATTENAFITRETDPYLLPRFCVSDDISFPEAICNMVGEWRPAFDPFKKAFQRFSKHTPVTQIADSAVNSCCQTKRLSR